MSEIITAEVVEVPKPERPELWVRIHGPQEEYEGEAWYRSDYPRADKSKIKLKPGELLVRIPGTAAPAPATATDAEIDIILNRLSAANGFVADAKDRTVSGLILDAMERLAKIRGGR